MNDVYCIVGITLFISSILMTIPENRTKDFNDFTKSLNNEQKNIYIDILKERTSLYLLGLFIGIFFAYLYYSNNKNDNFVFCKSLNIFSLTKFGFYFLSPKKRLMINYLKNEKQKKSYRNYSNKMRDKNLNSILIGFIGFIIIFISYKY